MNIKRPFPAPADVSGLPFVNTGRALAEELDYPLDGDGSLPVFGPDTEVSATDITQADISSSRDPELSKSTSPASGPGQGLVVAV